jgi:TolB-like protein
VLLGKISRRRVRRAMLIGGAVAAPIAAFSAWQFLAPHLDTTAAPALAVLPFTNLTGHADDVAFAAGLHDDLLTRLGSITAIRVIARTSVLGYAGTTERASQIARELGVNAVLEGSVQRSGQHVRVTVQLVDGATDSQKWGETYDRALTADNLFDIQREMTEAIAHALRTVLTAREMAAAFAGGTHNLEAYEAYARGRMLMRTADAGRDNAYLTAVAAFDQAISHDPNFAGAYSLKVYALSRSFASFEPNQNVDRPLREAARLALDRAGALAPDAAETQFAFAAYFYWGFLDYAPALQHLDRALAAAPNDADLWELKALITRRAGRFAESIAAFDRAILLDPLNTDAIGNAAYLLGNTGEFARAETLIARARAIDSTSVFFRYIAAALRYFQGDAAGAWTRMRGDRTSYNQMPRLFFAICTRDPANINFALRDWPMAFRHSASFPEQYNVGHAMALRTLGRLEEARRVLLQVKARFDTSANPYPDGWYSPISPDVVPGLLGDLAGVRAAERDFIANGPRDQIQRNDLCNSFAASFASAGDLNRAAYYLGESAKIVGPSLFLRISIDPSFDALRSHPGYLALKRSYEAWRAARR